jgi:hypothetical protein
MEDGSMPDRREPIARIPTFESLEAETAFWDQHDTTEFEDEWEPVEVEFGDPPRYTLTLTLEREEFHRLLAAARAQGVGPSALAQTWLRDALLTADTSKISTPVH